jgi:oxygen-dependent protoporphyrinogen oxidase
MAPDSWHVAVLGGGMTGLSAAFYLYRLAEERGLPIRVTLLEASGRLGGRIDTLRKDGYVIERGPDSFLARKTAMIELARDLGMEDELVGISSLAGKTMIVHRGRLHPMPQGLQMGIPTDLGAFARTGLISPLGKLRALCDLVIPRRRGDGDESVGEFLRRRLGREVVERIAEPLLAGIHAGDLDRLSLRATLPQFAQLERTHASLIRGLTATRRQAKPPQLPPEAQGKVFLSFRRGLLSVVEALDMRLRRYGCDIRLGVAARALEKGEPDGAPYRIVTEDGTGLPVHAVIVAVPAPAAASLLEAHVDTEAMRKIDYVSVANVVFGYDARHFGHMLDGSGFLVPRGEGRTITASTWTSTKWPHTAPAGKRLVRCYVGRAGDEAAVDLPDDALVHAVKRDLRELMGLEAKPELTLITRLPRSMPQYAVGHQERIAAFRRELSARLPGVLAAGAAFEGVGLPDCVAQGRKAAEQLTDMLARR